jgi:hypothetical protein
MGFVRGVHTSEIDVATRYISGITFIRYISGITFIRYAQDLKIKQILPETSRDTVHDLYTCISDIIIIIKKK